MQNPFQTILRFQNFFKFFLQRIVFFSLFPTLYYKDEKHEVSKKSILVLFYSAKSNSDHVTISIFSSFFFQKINFFYCFDPYTAQVRKLKSAKNHFLVLFYSAKSISDHFTISELFQVFFFKKKQFFALFRTLYCKGEKHEVRKKIIFSALL